jgi:DNA-binding MarR family transcriptional regulator
LTATDRNFGDDAHIRGVFARRQSEIAPYVDRTCTIAIRGRSAARLVAEWAKQSGLTEAELQLLWRLRSAPAEGFDQTALASALEFSPAQISASVERLRARGHICPSEAARDRRRRRWHLSVTGRDVLETVLHAARSSRQSPDNEFTNGAISGSREEAA